MSRYLTLNYYDGSLGGLQERPGGSMDVPSPGGMASIDHHWTHGLFGYGDRTLDVYSGTGDRYIYGEYGNMYTPNAHASLYEDYKGPHTDRTQYTDMHGDPYFWEYGGPATNKGQELRHHSGLFNMKQSLGRPVVPREDVGFVPSNIENFQYSSGNVATIGSGDPNVESSIEFIEDPNPPPKAQPAASPKVNTLNLPVKQQPQKQGTCKNPAASPKPVPIAKDIPDSQKTTEIKIIDASDTKKHKNNVVTVLVLVGVLVCIDLWGEFTHIFIAQYLNKGKDVTWVRYGIYAMVATIAVMITVQQSGINIKIPVHV